MTTYLIDLQLLFITSLMICHFAAIINNRTRRPK